MLRYCIQDAILFQLPAAVFQQFNNYTIQQFSTKFAVVSHFKKIGPQC